MIFKEILVDRLAAHIVKDNHPRLNGDSISGLAESMDQQGLLQPVCVAEMEDRSVRLIAGARRVLAAEMLGWQTITCSVRYACNEIELVALAAAENLQRVNPPANAYANCMNALVRELGSPSGVAGELGLTRQRVARCIRAGKAKSVRRRTSEPGIECPVEVGIADSEITATAQGINLANIATAPTSVDLRIAVVHNTTDANGMSPTSVRLCPAKSDGPNTSCAGLSACTCIPEELREPIKVMIESFQEARLVS